MFLKKRSFLGPTIEEMAERSEERNEVWCGIGMMIKQMACHIIECHDEIDRLERENEKLKHLVPEKEFAITMENARKYVIYRTARTPEEAEEMAMKDAGKFGEGEHRVISTNAY